MEQQNRINKYKNLTEKWSQRYNLLGIGLNFDKMIEQSRALLHFANPKPKSVSLDIGSGVGFPGILWSIEADITAHLLDRRKTVCTFLDYCSHSLELKNVTVHNADVREFTLPHIDFITAQAFSSLAQTVSYSKHLWNQNTQGLFLKTSDPTEEISELQTLHKVKIEVQEYKYGSLIKVSLV